MGCGCNKGRKRNQQLPKRTVHTNIQQNTPVKKIQKDTNSPRNPVPRRKRRK
tara:strand:- start:14 stop:169 length:156 start_codon:yes stop_codon:yes gene_type:complete